MSSSRIILNVPAPNTPYFTPAQFHPAGSAVIPQPDDKEIPSLFRPIRIRGLELHNRLVLAPMCQYSAEDGKVTPWHWAHLGGILTRGPGLNFIEATAVAPEGRITPEDLGLWDDSQVEPLRALVEFAHSQNQKIAIQLGHSGRKGSDVAPWLAEAAIAVEAAGGWPDKLVGPTNEPFSSRYGAPSALTKDGITKLVKQYVDAAKRAVKAGVDVIEIHSAHGFLLSSFLSPTSNTRTDEYGGDFENRIRLPLEIVDAIRSVIPPTMPLFYRISASEWLEETLPNVPSWRIEDTIRFAPYLEAHGVDLYDISSGGNHPQQHVHSKGQYQVPFSSAIKASLPSHSKLLVGAVGNITDGNTAQGILNAGSADLIFVGRLLQKNPGAVFKFAEELGVDIHMPHQIQWSFKGRGSSKLTV